MSSTTSTTPRTTTTELSLSEGVEDHSRAEVQEIVRSGEAMGSSSITISTHADPDDQQVWLSIRLHTYTSLDWGSYADNSLSRGLDLISQHFSRQEAEALLAVLTHELGKFQADDKALLAELEEADSDLISESLARRNAD